jgi:putative inorganic carbon (hco3(-)) transporter
MAPGVGLWLLVVLLSIYFTGDYPWVGLGIGGLGGVGLGAYLWKQASRRSPCSTTRPGGGSLVGVVNRHDVLLCLPALLVLSFASRSPSLLVPLSSVAWLLVVGAMRRRAIRSPQADPLALPILLIAIASAASLFWTVDVRQSVGNVCMLAVGVVLYHGLVTSVATASKVRVVGSLFLVTGAAIALGAVFAMKFPMSKIPIVSTLYPYLPDLFARTIHPNYVGGSLAGFFALSFWHVLKSDGLTVCTPREGKAGASKKSNQLKRNLRGGKAVWRFLCLGIIGAGLLLTQSRGALGATCVALLLTGTYWYRWLRLSLPAAIVTGGVLFCYATPDGYLSHLTANRLMPALAGRWELWQRAVYAIQDFPYTGIGLGSFPDVVSLLYPLFLDNPHGHVPHAHNLFLDIAVAVGVPGYVAFMALLGAWSMMVWEVVIRYRRGPTQSSPEIPGLSLAAGMIAHLLFGMTDAIPLGEKAGLFFWGVLGLTTALWVMMRKQRGGDAG